MVGDLNVNIKRGISSSKRHNIVDISSMKHYISTDSQFHQIPKFSLEELRKQNRRIIRIIDIRRNDYNQEVLLVMLDGCAEIDLIKISKKDLKRCLPRRELIRVVKKIFFIKKKQTNHSLETTWNLSHKEEQM